MVKHFCDICGKKTDSNSPFKTSLPMPDVGDSNGLAREVDLCTDCSWSLVEWVKARKLSETVPK